MQERTRLFQREDVTEVVWIISAFAFLQVLVLQKYWINSVVIIQRSKVV